MKDKRVLILIAVSAIFFGFLSLAYRTASSLATISLASINDAGINTADFTKDRRGLPERVTGVRVDSSDCGVDLFWNGITGARGYRIYKGDSVGAETIYSGSNGIQFTDTNVKCGKKYSYRISAINNKGEGLKSSPVQIVPEE